MALPLVVSPQRARFRSKVAQPGRCAHAAPGCELAMPSPMANGVAGLHRHGLLWRNAPDGSGRLASSAVLRAAVERALDRRTSGGSGACRPHFVLRGPAPSRPGTRPVTAVSAAAAWPGQRSTGPACGLHQVPLDSAPLDGEPSVCRLLRGGPAPSPVTPCGGAGRVPAPRRSLQGDAGTV